MQSSLSIGAKLQGRCYSIDSAPSMRMLIWWILGVRFIYIFWGYPWADNILLRQVKRMRFKWALRLADHVIVNDSMCLEEASQVVKETSKVKMFRYPIDLTYFKGGITDADRKKLQGLGIEPAGYYLCVGNVDRDDLFLSLLSQHLEHPVIRCTISMEVKQHHERENSNVTVLYCISEADMAALYRGALAVVLPIKDRGTASGQHVIIEALASDVPIVVSQTRISSEFSEYSSVKIMEQSATVESWVEVIESIQGAKKSGSTRLNLDQHAPRLFNDFLSSLLGYSLNNKISND